MVELEDLTLWTAVEGVGDPLVLCHDGPGLCDDLGSFHVNLPHRWKVPSCVWVLQSRLTPLAMRRSRARFWSLRADPKSPLVVPLQGVPCRGTAGDRHSHGKDESGEISKPFGFEPDLSRYLVDPEPPVRCWRTEHVEPKSKGDECQEAS